MNKTIEFATKLHEIRRVPPACEAMTKAGISPLSLRSIGPGGGETSAESMLGIGSFSKSKVFEARSAPIPKRLVGLQVLENESAISQATKRTQLSERQYGAFHWLWLVATGKLAPQIDEEKIGCKTLRVLRNDVVHRGYHPSENEARRYDELVFGFLKEGHCVLKANYSKELRRVGFTRHPKVNATTVYLPTILDTAKPHTNSFRSSIRRLEHQLEARLRAEWQKSRAVRFCFFVWMELLGRVQNLWLGKIFIAC